MPISPIGSIIYANQQAPAVSLAHQNIRMQTELQSFFAQELFKEKEVEVEAVSQAKESDSIDPDRHFSDREYAHKEKKEKKESTDDEAEQEAPHSSLHILDIKV